MLRPEMLHPMIVHFPIALIIVALGVFATYAFTGKDFFKRVGAWAITLGALSAAAAVMAGLVAEANASHGDAAHEILEKFHEPLALAVLALSVFLTIWGFVSNWQLAGGKLIAYLIILFTTVVVLGLTGHYGAMMVYEHGMGVNPEVLKQVVHEHSGGDGHNDHGSQGEELGAHDDHMGEPDSHGGYEHGDMPGDSDHETDAHDSNTVEREHGNEEEKSAGERDDHELHNDGHEHQH